MADSQASSSTDFATLTGGPTLRNVDPAADANPYTSIVAEPEHVANIAVAGTVSGDPVAAGRVNMLHRQTGIPTDIIDADLRPAVAAVRTAQATAAISVDPKLAAWSTDSRNTAVAHDDYPTLSRIGGTFGTLSAPVIAPTVANYLKGIWTSVVQGGAQIGAAFDHLAADFIPAPNLSRPGVPQLGDFGQENARIASQRALGRIDAARPAFASGTAGTVYDAVSGLAQSIPAVGAAILTGNPLIGAAAMGAQAAAPAYSKYRDRGGTPAQAVVGSTLEGGIAAAAGLLPTGFLVDKLGKVGLGKFVSGFLVRDLGSMEAGAVGQSAVDAAVANPDMTVDKYFHQLPGVIGDAAVSALVNAGSFGLVHMAAHLLAERGQTTVASNDAAFLGDLASGSDASLTRKRDPDAFEQFLHAQADGTPAERLYIPAAKVRELYQSERFLPGAADDTLFGFQPDIAEQLRQAEATGGDVVLDTAKAMTHLPGTPLWDAIRPDVRIRPDGLSMRDVADHGAAFDDAMEASGRAAADEAKARLKDAAPQQQVFDAVHGQAKDAGFGTNAARAYAELFAARYRARGEATGTDAFTAYNASSPKIVSDLPASLEPYRKSDGVDVLINAMRRKSGDGDSNGPSLLEYIARNGGMRDPDGDLAAMGVGDWHKEKPFRRRLIRDGGPPGASLPGIGGEVRNGSDSVDGMAEGAFVDGYFPDGSEAPDRGRFLAAVEAELRGQHVRYAEDVPGSATANVRAAADDLRAMLEQRGIDADKASPAAIKAAIDAHVGESGGRTLSQPERGSISFGPAGALIRLFEHRDLSTTLHEGGHLFLEELKFDAGSDGAQAQVKADYGAVLKWFADQGHAVGADGAISTEAHELFARGFERYLMEGKAPSSGLARAFSTFRSWLLRIYQLAGNLGSPITDEVRGVMGRLLATQQEVDAAALADHDRLLFKDAAAAGMTSAEFAAYRGSVSEARSAAMDALVYRTMETVRRARTTEWNAERSKLRATVASEVAARPEFKALDLLRSPDKARRVALDREAIVSQFGADALKMIPKGVPPTVVEGGLHPDLLAEMVGLPTGAELIDRLMGVQQRAAELKAAGDRRSPRDEAIDQAADALMRDRHGDVLTDGSIEEEARAAIHNDVRSSIIASEARALARRVGETATPWKVARAWAERQVRGAPVRDAVSAAALQRHQRAENKAARLAEAALAAGDVDETFRQKQAQMLNDALYRETKAAKDQVEVAAKRLSKLAATKTLASMDQDYLDQIHGLLEAYDFKTRSGPAINERAAFTKFVADQEALGNVVFVPPRLLDADAVNYRSMTTDDLLGLDDAVQSLAHLGRQKKKLLLGKEEREFDSVVGTALKVAASLPDRKFSNERNPKPKLVGKIAAELTRVEFIADELDGFDPNGPFNRILVQGATVAANMKDRLKREVLDPLATMYHGLADKKRLQERIVVPEFPTTHADGTSEPTVFRRMDLLAVALNTGNESNLDKMVRGERWHPEAVQAVLDRELNADDWRFVEKAWRQVDSLWPEIARVERELTGIVPEKIEPRMVKTPGGEIAGGYWPVVYDPLRSDSAARAYEGDADSMFGQIGRVASTPKGHTVTRTDFAAPLNLSLESVLLNHINRVTTRLAYGRYVRDTLKFISDPRIKNLIDSKRGLEDYNRLRPWLQGQVNDAKMDTAALSGLDRILKQSRVNATIVGLGLRATTAVQHFSYLANSSKEIGADWVFKGVAASVSNFGSNKDFIYARSEEMAGRAQTFDANIRDAFAQMGTRFNGGTVHDSAIRAQEMAQHVAFWFMEKFLINVVGIPTWLGAYHKAISQGMSEVDAAHYGDKVIRRAQGAGRAKDASGFQMGSEAYRQMGMFYSYFGTLINQEREAFRAARRVVNGDGLGGDKLRVASTLFWIAVAEPLVVSAFKGDGPADGEDPGEWVLRKVLGSLWGGLPVIRDVASGIEQGAMHHQPPASYVTTAIGNSIPAGRAVVSLLTTLNDTGVLGNEPSDRWLQHAIETPGYFLGLPTGQPAATAQYLYDVHKGTQRPTGPADVVAGLLHGHEKRQE